MERTATHAYNREKRGDKKGSVIKPSAVSISFSAATHHWLSHLPLVSGVETLTANMRPWAMKQLDRVATPLEHTLFC